MLPGGGQFSSKISNKITFFHYDIRAGWDISVLFSVRKNSGGVRKNENEEERKYCNNSDVSCYGNSDNRSKLCGL